MERLLPPFIFARLGLISPLRQPRRAVYFYLLFFAYFLTAAIVLHLFMGEFGFGDAKHTWLDFQRYLDHETKRPYAYRVLAPAAIRALSAGVPETIRHRIETVEAVAPDSNLSKKLREVRTVYNWRTERTVERMVGHAFLFANLFGVLLLLRHITRRVYGYSRLFVDFAPVVALSFLPMTFLNCGFVYDFPEIFLALACLALLLAKRWIPYYLCFILACLNKETGVFTVVYFLALYLGSMTRKQIGLHVALHVVLGGITVMSVRAAMADNPGTQAEFHLWSNLAFFLRPSTYYAFTDNFALLIPVPRSYNVLNLALFIPLVFIGWKEKPLWVRMNFLAIMAIITPLYIAFGAIDEIRVYYLALPAIYLLCIHTVHTCAVTIQASAPVPEERAS